ncbi:MAG: DNA-3-methyladenine glycosylase I [Methylovulum sp.]|nr:DNA-3-methyladenine glycosylase I [Methylovulum sp.]
MATCPWALASPLEAHYHDHEWGVPVHDDRTLFEFLILEGAQAGLSWVTVLKKREGYRNAFDNFDAEIVAGYGDDKLNELVANPEIIRNRLKIHAAVSNAQAFLKVQQEFGSFNHYIWQFVGGRPLYNAWIDVKEIPVATLQSDAMSKDLKKRGFKFVGRTICYAYMQATGMVNDHLSGCFRHQQLKIIEG